MTFDTEKVMELLREPWIIRNLVVAVLCLTGAWILWSSASFGRKRRW